MTDWSELWGDSDEDDEDYDPMKDEAVRGADDSESDSFEGDLSATRSAWHPYDMILAPRSETYIVAKES
jgi:hypothetical protein